MTGFEYLKKFNAPMTCIHCGASLVLNERMTKLSCPNMSCSSRTVSRISRWTRKALTWAPKTITKLLEAGLITTISSLYKIDYSKVAQLDGMGERSAEKLKMNLEKSTKTMSLAKFISGFNIEDVGEKVIQKIIDAKHFENFEDLSKSNYQDFVCDGVGEITAKKLYDGIAALKDDMFETLKYIEIIKEQKPDTKGKSLEGLSFCFTGKACMPRSQLEKIVVEYGGTISSVKVSLSYLVTDDDNSVSSKSVKAKKLGIKKITSYEFLDMIK